MNRNRIDIARIVTFVLVASAAFPATEVLAQRRSRRTAMMTFEQADRLFAQAVQAADELGQVDIQPGDANGQVRAWDGRWSRFVEGLDSLSMSATCGNLGPEAECGRHAVDALMCNLDSDIESARRAVFAEGIFHDAFLLLPVKIRARREVADEAIRRQHEQLSCEDIEDRSHVEQRLREEYEWWRRRQRGLGGALEGDPTHSSSESIGAAVPRSSSTATTAPQRPEPPPSTSPPSAPSSTSLSFEEAERAVRDTIAAFEDLDVVFVDGSRAVRRRSMADALLLIPAVDSWRARWPNLARDTTNLTAMDCAATGPTRELSCGIGADVSRWMTSIQAASTDRDPRRAFDRAHAANLSLLGVLRGRLRRADAHARRLPRDPMSRLLVGG